MAWPPVLPPATRANATPQLDAHPLDHNSIATALAALVGGAWVALPVVAGWGVYASDAVVQYRLMGDRVEVRGSMSRAGNVNVPIALTTALPAGFRPPATVRFVAALAGAFGVCSVSPAGIITAEIVAGNAFSAVWFHAGTSWSVTV